MTTTTDYPRRAFGVDGTVHGARYAGSMRHFVTACAAYPAPEVDRLDASSAAAVTCPDCIVAMAGEAAEGGAATEAPFTMRRLRHLWDTERDSERMGAVRDMLRNTDCDADDDHRPTDAGLQRIADVLNQLHAAAVAIP